jgi:hypothetical protein
LQGRIEINGTVYLLSEMLAPDDGHFLGWQLCRPADGCIDASCYSLFATDDGMACNCPDAQYRRGPHGCKHSHALTASIERLEISIP